MGRLFEEQRRIRRVARDLRQQVPEQLYDFHVDIAYDVDGRATDTVEVIPADRHRVEELQERMRNLRGPPS